MSRAPRLFLVCYDVRDPKRLRRVYKVMRGFGDHVQFSVFRCVLSETQLARMEGRLLREINCNEDQILVVPLGLASVPAEERMHTLGQPLLDAERVVRIL